MSLEVLDRHSEALFEFLWCPVCGQEVFTSHPSRVFCKNCNTQVELQESRRNTRLRGCRARLLRFYHHLNLHIDEKLRRDLPDGSARVKIRRTGRLQGRLVESRAR